MLGVGGVNPHLRIEMCGTSVGEGEQFVQRVVLLQGEDLGCGFEDREQLELAEGYGGHDRWGYLFVEQADGGLGAIVDGEHGDAVGCGGRGNADGPALEDSGWEKGEVDRENEVPVASGMGERGLDTADGTAVGVKVGNEGSVGSEFGITAEDIDVRADVAELGYSVGDEGFAGELQ
jgi:hypothetical protein